MNMEDDYHPSRSKRKKPSMEPDPIPTYNSFGVLQTPENDDKDRLYLIRTQDLYLKHGRLHDTAKKTKSGQNDILHLHFKGTKT